MPEKPAKGVATMIQLKNYCLESPAACAALCFNITTEYEIIPPIAIRTPTILLSPTARPLVSQPNATIEQVLRCPTTVLDTGPVCAMMKNCDMLMREANMPLIIIMIHRFTGTCDHTGNVSTKGMTYRSMKALTGAWLKSNCMLFICNFLW